MQWGNTFAFCQHQQSKSQLLKYCSSITLIHLLLFVCVRCFFSLSAVSVVQLWDTTLAEQKFLHAGGQNETKRRYVCLWCGVYRWRSANTVWGRSSFALLWCLPFFPLQRPLCIVINPNTRWERWYKGPICHLHTKNISLMNLAAIKCLIIYLVSWAFHERDLIIQNPHVYYTMRVLTILLYHKPYSLCHTNPMNRDGVGTKQILLSTVQSSDAYVIPSYMGHSAKWVLSRLHFKFIYLKKDLHSNGCAHVGFCWNQTVRK